MDTEIASKVKNLMTILPEEYNLEYLVYSASTSLSDEETVWDLEYHKVFRRMMFKKFDSFIEESVSKLGK